MHWLACNSGMWRHVDRECITDHLSFISNKDVLETSYEVLDELWKVDESVYPQHRMVHLMDIIANSVVRHIQSKLALIDLWLGKFSEVDAALTQVCNPERRFI